jgi:hypothetical protein
MKLKNPFLGLQAKGKFGNIVVANSLRGLQIFKAKTNPSNPNTGEQLKYRNIYRNGRLYYHELHLTELERNALSRVCRLIRWRATPYVYFMSCYLWSMINVGDYRHANQVISSSPSPGTLYVSCNFIAGVSVYLGVNRKFTRNFQYHAMNPVGATGKYEATIMNLIPGDKEYFWILYLHPFAGFFEISGIFTQKV